MDLERLRGEKDGEQSTAEGLMTDGLRELRRLQLAGGVPPRCHLCFISDGSQTVLSSMDHKGKEKDLKQGESWVILRDLTYIGFYAGERHGGGEGGTVTSQKNSFTSTLWISRKYCYIE